MVSRRKILKATATGLATAPGFSFAAAERKKPLRAALIGHTGRGNFGHRLDIVFRARDNIEVVAVADPDEKGRAAAQKRSHAKTAYAEYREMQKKESPDLGAVHPTLPRPHFARGIGDAPDCLPQQ